jgi:hypothetical protein
MHHRPGNRHLILPGGLATLLCLVAGSAPAQANLNEGLLNLVSGKADCQGKRFAAGVKRLLEAAVQLQEADPKHPGNRQWLPEVQSCLKGWMTDAGKRCETEGKVGALEELLAIQKQIQYLNVPQVKTALPARQTACVKAIAKLSVMECDTSPGQKALAVLEAVKTQLTRLGVDPKTLPILDTGLSGCAQKWILDAESRCQSAATVGRLQEISGAVPRVLPAQRPRAQQAYETCAKAIGQLGYATCQSRRFLEGRTLLKEAISRYDFFGVKDRRYLEQMRSQWLPRCGAYVLRGHVSGQVTVGGTAFKLDARLQLEVGRTGQGNTLVGEMRTTYLAVSGAQKGCRVLITPTDGRYSLTGSENPAARSAAVMPDPAMPQTEAFEEIQIMCGEAPPRLARAKYLHGLLRQAGLFAIKTSTAKQAKTSYAWRGALDGGAQATVSAALTCVPLE